jgi:NAD(P)H-hydrate repair Nnr-like enzyme with NAD(P)H-hydrate epimerase domain
VAEVVHEIDDIDRAGMGLGEAVVEAFADAFASETVQRLLVLCGVGGHG